MSESEKGSGGGGVANVDFLSTHPANAKRIKVRVKSLSPSEGDADFRVCQALEKWMSEVRCVMSGPH